MPVCDVYPNQDQLLLVATEMITQTLLCKHMARFILTLSLFKFLTGWR